jgi:Bacterial membrane protein YfhO
MGNYKVWAAFALATVIFYFSPLFEAQTSIQWDAVDVHYSAQKYFADNVREGHLPHWTPYVFSGFPFLADPQTGAWYPLHWPFFLIGITPKAIEWELALHAFLALCGTYLLSRRLGGDHMVALIASVFYAGGGFFAAHSSHVGIFETAALLPWLLWSALLALESETMLSLLLPGAIGGLILLIGHFQSALYSFFAMALFIVAKRAPWKRTVSVLAVATLAAMLLGAIQILPGLELTAQSDRAAANFHGATNAALKPAALATLMMPNFYGAVNGSYSGPPDITQFYFYAGILLLPLAIVGIWKQRSWLVLALIVPALWYAFGPPGGLYFVLTLLPGFKSVRAPVHIWFVVALGLALAAATGAAWLAERFRKSWLMIAVLMLSVADLWYWNMADNQMAYMSTSFAEKYGDPYTNFQNALAQAKLKRFMRIWAPFDTNAFGPLNSALEGRSEVTWGYNPLELSRYSEYLAATEGNTALLNGLAVTHGIDPQRGAMFENTNVLPRIYAPPQVKFVASHAAAKALLPTLNPTQWAIVEAPLRPIAPGPTKVEIVSYTGDSYRAKYSAPFDCLLRIAVPYFPGWTAAIDGKSTAVYAVDDAFSGVFAPVGDHELTFRYKSNWFPLGAAVSGLTVAGYITLAFFWSSAFLRRRR